MNTQTKKALEMAIETLEAFEITGYCDEAIQSCKEALAQPAQEPVGYTEPADLLSVPEGDTGLWFAKKDERYSVALYTHPAPSWQGLSREEVESIVINVFIESDIEINNTKSCSVFECYLALEQALKEKNHGD
jgi:hypothetical protein